MKFSTLRENFNKFSNYPYWKLITKGVKREWFPVFITYPFFPKPRYGWGLPPHNKIDEIINQNRSVYESSIKGIINLKDSLCKISISGDSISPKPFWANKWFTGIDAAVLYYLIVREKPKRYLEIGSGNSTKFARQAVIDYGLDTEIICIDPNPRAEIREVADRIYREPLEKINLDIFSEVNTGDIVFFDGSHRCFMGSDVTVFFLEVLPNLPVNTLIQIHDIHLPYDYPSHRIEHYESEQYLLAVMLLMAMERYEIVMPNRYVIEDKYFSDLLKPLWSCSQGEIVWTRGSWKRGSSFWFKFKS